PMGSMTGAPKVSAMDLISKHEVTERGVYSGSIGYIEPNGDFDFNVVIRSVQYDRLHKTVSCHVGGAITSLCDAEAEYQECLLKAEAVLNALRG
ncbi:MAG: chorismate-binding protein, partial [Flavobacteriales bacterium]